MQNIISTDSAASLVSQVRSIIPQYVVEDHPKFVEFLKSYYRWSSLNGPIAAMNYMKVNNDIDFVKDSMLDGYMNLFAYNIPRDMKVDYRFFLKFLKSFYEIKGTDESYRIFYNALFGEDVLIFYPKRSMFIPSSATWSNIKTFNVDCNLNLFDFRGSVLKGENNAYECTISDVIKINNNWVISFDNSSGDFEPNEVVYINDTMNTARVLPVFDIKSFKTNSRWSDNEIMKLTNGVTLKVDKIYDGEIISLAIVSGGGGYAPGEVLKTSTDSQGTGFKGVVTSTDSNGAVTGVSVQRSGFGYKNADVAFFVDGSNGDGLILTPLWNDNFMKVKSLSIISNTIKKNDSDVEYYIGDGESVTFKSGVYTSLNLWGLLRGAPSTSTAIIQDSFYTQEYSYVLSSNANVSDNLQSIKKVLQIAGLKMFVEQSVSLSKSCAPRNSIIFN